MMLVAALDHAARVAFRALAERSTGFSSYENGDYLQAEAARVAFVDQDAEQEVAEPAPAPECECWVGHGDCGGCSGYPGITHEPACGWEWTPDCPVHAPQSPAVSAGGAESSSPEVSAPPTAPSGERATPGAFAAVAVLNVLADHQFRADPGSDPDFDQAGCCTCSVALPMDEYDWRGHVAAEIQRRIDAALTSQTRQQIETGHDMGVSIASEFFPQHRRPQK